MLLFDTSTDNPSFAVIGSNISKVAEFGSTLDNAYVSFYANDPLSNVGYLVGSSNENSTTPVFSIGMINTDNQSIYPDFTLSNHFIGINTSKPFYTLDVNGSINVTNRIFNNNLQTGYWYNPNANLYTYSNVGIGITNSASKLHVVGSTYITGDVYASNLKPSAYIDTTIANNITSGTLPLQRLPIAPLLTPAIYGSVVAFPTFTVDQYGRITYASNIALSASATTDTTNAENITSGALPLSQMPTTNVISPPATYGSKYQVPQITIDIYGRVNIASNIPIEIETWQISDIKPVAIYGNYSNLYNTPFYYDPLNTTYYMGSGNIGIGTYTASQGKLHVEGDGYFNGALIASNLNIIGELTTVNVETSNFTQLDIINANPGPGLKVVQKNNDQVAEFYNNNHLALRINGDGNIGVGTSVATKTLYVQGDVGISGTVSGGGLVSSAFIDTTNADNITSGTLSATRLATSGVSPGYYGYSNALPVIQVDSKGRVTFAMNCNIQIFPGQVTGLQPVATTNDYNSLINRTFILNNTIAHYSAGNVGIGTNLAESTLTIGSGDTSSTLKINVTDKPNNIINDRIYLTAGGASNSRISHSASNLVIYSGQSNTAGTFHLMTGAVGGTQYSDRITVNSLGYVGINNAFPNYSLDVIGNISYSGTLYNGSTPLATSGKLLDTALPDTTVSAGNYGTALSNVNIQVDRYGRITSLSNVLNVIPYYQVTGLAPSSIVDTTNADNITSGTLSATRLATSGVTTGYYGYSNALPVIQVDSKGRVTFAINCNIQIFPGQVTGLAPSATIDATNATNITSGTLDANRLAVSGVNAASYGAANSNVSITVDTKGRVTSLANTAVIIPTNQITGLAPSATIDTTNATNITSGTLDANRLAVSGVTANSYGAANSNVSITVDTKGRVTSLANTAVIIPTNQITGLAPSATIDTTNATNISSGTLNLSRLPTTNIVTSGTFGTASTTQQIVTDSYGRVTNVTPTTIAITTSQISGLAPSATTDTTNATNITSGILSSNILQTSGVTAGTYGSQNSNIQFVVDTKGRIIDTSNILTILPTSQITGLAPSATIDTTNATNISSGTLNLSRLPTTNVLTSGTFGSASTTPQIVTDTYGRVTNVTPITIAIASNAVSGLSKAAGTGIYNDLISTPFTYSAAATSYYNGTGNVGIGTQTATTKLHVVGDILASGTLIASNLNILGELTTVNVETSNYTQLDILNANAGPALKVVQLTPDSVIEFYNNVGSVIQMAASGNLGIGTKNPTKTLYVQGDVGISGTISGGGLTNSAFTDTTNATNISSGTLNLSRLPTTNVATNGSFGSATQVAQLTTDIYGRVTNIANQSIQLPLSQITGLAASASNDTTNATNITSGTLLNSVFPLTGVTSNVYGFSNTIPQFVVDGTGRISRATNIPISILTDQVTGLYPTALSANSPVSTPTAGTYGTAASGYIPVLTLDSYGRITVAQSSPITVSTAYITGNLPLSQISGLAASASNDTTNATNITSGTLNLSRLPTTNVATNGTFGSATQVAQVTTDIYGRVTNVTNQSIQIPTSQITGLATSATTDTTNATNITSGRLSSNVLQPTLINNTGTYGNSNTLPVVTVDQYGRIVNISTSNIKLNSDNLPIVTGIAGSYGSSTSIPNFTVDTYGRVTSAGNNPIVLSGVAASGQYSNLLNIPFVYDTVQTSNIYTPSYIQYVGIGMSNATAYPLDVNGTIRATQFIGDGSQLTGVITGSGSFSGGGFNSQWASCNMYISIVGSNVGIGTTYVSPTNALQVQGNAFINGTTSTCNIVTSNITVLNNYFIANDSTVYRSALQINPIRQFFTVQTLTQSVFSLTSPTVGRYTATGSNIEIYQNGIKLGYQDAINNDYSVSVIQNSTSTQFTITLVNSANQGDYIDITVWPQLVSTDLSLQPGYVYQQFYDLWSASNNNVYYNSGNIGIGTITPNYPLHVVGTIYTTNSVITSSDRNIKTNVATITDALETVKKLRGVSYNRKDNGQKQIGMIAQELQEIVPEVVSEGQDGLAVAYGNIVGLLVEAIKEMSQEISELKKRIT